MKGLAAFLLMGHSMVKTAFAIVSVFLLTSCNTGQGSYSEYLQACLRDYPKATFEQCTMVALNVCQTKGCKNG